MRSNFWMAWTTYRPVSAVGTRAWTVMWYWLPVGWPPRAVAARYWSANAPAGLMPGASSSPRSVPPTRPVRSPMVSRTSRNRAWKWLIRPSMMRSAGPVRSLRSFSAGPFQDGNRLVRLDRVLRTRWNPPRIPLINPSMMRRPTLARSAPGFPNALTTRPGRAFTLATALDIPEPNADLIRFHILDAILRRAFPALLNRPRMVDIGDRRKEPINTPIPCRMDFTRFTPAEIRDRIAFQAAESRARANCQALDHMAENVFTVARSLANCWANQAGMDLNQSTTALATVLMPSHSPIQKLRKASERFQRVTNAATRPTMARTTRPMGLAAMTTFTAVVTARTMAMVLLNAAQAATMDPMATARVAMVSRLRMNQATRSPTAVMMPARSGPRVSRAPITPDFRESPVPLADRPASSRAVVMVSQAVANAPLTRSHTVRRAGARSVLNQAARDFTAGMALSSSQVAMVWPSRSAGSRRSRTRSEEHTSELQSRGHIVFRR